MNKTKLKIIKISSLVVLGTIALILLYNVCIFQFAFKPNFGRCKKERTVEHEIQFFCGEENYNIHMNDVKWFEEQKCPLIEITSQDGLKLKAFVLEPEQKAEATVLLMHGYYSGPVREFATISRFLYKNNYRVILPYQRAHGESEGKWATFGINERYDCLDWVNKINELYGEDKPVFVGGISMGCATITMASGLKMPQNVRGYIADCGFTSPYEICYWTMLKKMHIPRSIADLLIYSLNWQGTHFCNFPMNRYSTQKALSHADRPFIFITGSSDTTVPYEMTMSNYLQYKMIHPETRLLLVEGGEHAVSYLLKKDEYEKMVLDFIKTYK